MTERKYLAINEAARFLGVSRSKFYSLLKNNTFPASLKFDGVRRWNVDEIDNWAQAQAAGN
ncbi:MAG: helix-turn-helix domain-containing protein [Synergistaceae bacterium]|nr:helix-turn-helix domain-containing protein [Synergistaceae bacterium]MBQ4418882.1 helix-turn-helix domain-containing protein [Synergistaceae bacterium]MBQ6909481.1 helix-turn-helix domain-containing protein [Synergistaceae bacterium]MBR0221361.1 helix-turn-helix domain-containing protein [Synergistaceae bacterium]